MVNFKISNSLGGLFKDILVFMSIVNLKIFSNRGRRLKRTLGFLDIVNFRIFYNHGGWFIQISNSLLRMILADLRPLEHSVF